MWVLVQGGKNGHCRVKEQASETSRTEVRGVMMG